jgi:hypothetical protein
MRTSLAGIFLVLLFICGCKKEDSDVSAPGITWTSPYETQQFNVFDTIHVNVQLTDDKQLVSVQVKLVDENLVPVLPGISVSISGTNWPLEFDYPIANIRMTTGTYYVYVEVSDGMNVKNAYRGINITEAPLELKGFFAATTPGVNLVDIYRADTSWTPVLSNPFVSDFTDLEVSSWWQQVYISGAFTGPLRAISIDGQFPGWSIPATQSAIPFWGPMNVNGPMLNVSYPASAQVKNIDVSGNPGFYANADPGFYPDNQVQAGNMIYIEEKDFSSSAIRMVVFSTSGGAIQETAMPIDAVELFERDGNNIYVAGNSAGQGHLLIYDFMTNGFWEPIVLPAGQVLSATQVDYNTLLIAMDNGTIYRFTYSPVGLLIIGTGINASQVRFDPGGNRVFTAEGSDVKIYNYNPFFLQETVAFPLAVRDLELWFNK